LARGIEAGCRPDRRDPPSRPEGQVDAGDPKTHPLCLRWALAVRLIAFTDYVYRRFDGVVRAFALSSPRWAITSTS